MQNECAIWHVVFGMVCIMLVKIAQLHTRSVLSFGFLYLSYIIYFQIQQRTMLVFCGGINFTSAAIGKF